MNRHLRVFLTAWPSYQEFLGIALTYIDKVVIPVIANLIQKVSLWSVIKESASSNVSLGLISCCDMFPGIELLQNVVIAHVVYKER